MIDKTRWIRDLINGILMIVLGAAILRSWAILPIINELPQMASDIQDYKVFKGTMGTKVDDIYQMVRDLHDQINK